MVHNTALKAAEKFQSATKFDAEDMLIDLFYWFDKSIKRKNELFEFCSFCDMQYKDVVKHISTRWLSLEFAVERALKQYKGLRSYIFSNAESQAGFQRLQKAFD